MLEKRLEYLSFFQKKISFSIRKYRYIFSTVPTCVKKKKRYDRASTVLTQNARVTSMIRENDFDVACRRSIINRTFTRVTVAPGGVDRPGGTMASQKINATSNCRKTENGRSHTSGFHCSSRSAGRAPASRGRWRSSVLRSSGLELIITGVHGVCRNYIFLVNRLCGLSVSGGEGLNINR